MTEGRKIVGVPVVDPVTASVAIARLCAARVGIVTTVETMVPGIWSMLDRMGASAQCSVVAAGIGVAEAAAADPETHARLDDAVMRARREDGAGAIILGSGALAGKARPLSQRHKLPVIDCIEAAVLMALATAQCLPVSRAA